MNEMVRAIIAIGASAKAITTIRGSKTTPMMRLTTATRNKQEDAIQDVFLKLLNHKFAGSEITNLKFYLFRSLKNRFIDLHKNKIINEELDSCDFDFSIKVSILDDIIEAENKKILEQRINKLLDSLTSRQREAIVLRYVHELGYDEIASLLDMTPKASRKLVSRAMERMRNQELLLLLILFCKF